MNIKIGSVADSITAIYKIVSDFENILEANQKTPK